MRIRIPESTEALPRRIQNTPETLQPLNLAGVDQQSIEPAGFGAILAGVEDTLAPEHDLLLLIE
jgi:hypothetical protein